MKDDKICFPSVYDSLYIFVIKIVKYPPQSRFPFFWDTLYNTTENTTGMKMYHTYSCGTAEVLPVVFMWYEKYHRIYHREKYTTYIPVVQQKSCLWYSCFMKNTTGYTTEKKNIPQKYCTAVLWCLFMCCSLIPQKILQG